MLQRYGGISRYICNLAEQLAQVPDHEARIFAPLHFNEHLGALKAAAGKGQRLHKGCMLPGLPPKFNRLVMEASKFWAHRSVNRFSPDIIHETYFSTDDFKPRRAKRVLTVHDMIHERYSEMFEGSEYTIGPKRAASLRADHIICVSESTRQDLIEFCNVPKEKTSVVYHGVDTFFQSTSSSLEVETFSGRPYVLYVGKRDGYKNFEGFIRAFSKSSRLIKDFDIMCFGGGALSNEENIIAVELGFSEGQIKFIGGSDRILAQLYRDASAFIYPSLYEGFGIPPLEAMASGCPVICSNTSSLPEVVGTAGEYFDPKDKEEIMAAIERVVYSETQREYLIEKGIFQYNKFSWKKCSEETLNIYKSLM